MEKERKRALHGGDVYRNEVELDFSVNINPLGIPPRVQESLHAAVLECTQYPDLEGAALKDALGTRLGVEAAEIVCGNGASELFVALAHALQPKRAVLPVPSFLGYEKALQGAGCRIAYYFMRKENGFCLDQEIKALLTEDVDMLFLTNPNNPVGNLMEQAILLELLEWCREKKIIVVLDECFIGFLQEEQSASMIKRVQEFPNLIVVQAFTKLYAIPGVRLGYLLCGSREMKEKIERQLPEWNLSIFAQRAGVAALEETAYVSESVQLLAAERLYLEKAMRELDIQTYPSETNFMLLETEMPLYEKLLREKILIRDCSNFRGLGEGFYRIAVKKRQENERLIQAIRKIKEG